MYYFLYFSFILCVIPWTNAVADIKDKDVKNGTINKSPDNSNSTLDDRINIVSGKASAHSKDDNGGFSGSNSNSWGIQVGFKNLYTGKYSSLLDTAGSLISGYSSGEDAPKTWADTNSSAGRYSASGTSNSGFSGGHGTSQSETQSQSKEYNLGGGLSILSNLDTDKARKNKTKTDAVSEKKKEEKPNTENSKPSSEKKPTNDLKSELVFQ